MRSREVKEAKVEAILCQSDRSCASYPLSSTGDYHNALRSRAHSVVRERGEGAAADFESIDELYGIPLTATMWGYQKEDTFMMRVGLRCQQGAL